MGLKFVAVRKGPDGSIEQVLTNEGHLLSIEEAARMARSGEVDSLSDVHPDGSWEIQDNYGRDEYSEGFNLGILPEF